MPLGICRQEIRGSATRGRKLSRCLPCLWWRGSCVEFGLLEQRRWLRTTALVLLCIRATRWAQRKESGACVTFCGQTVLQSSTEDEEGYVVTTATTLRLERLGLKSLTAFHDLTNAFGLVKWEAMDRAAAKSVGTELPPWTAEIQAGDHYGPGQAQNWSRWADG